MKTRRDFLKTVGAGAAALAAGRRPRGTKAMADEALPPLEAKAYRIGIAPSHITTSPDALFAPRAQWQALRERIDFYKLYAVQLVDTKWASRLTPGAFVDFAKRNGIAVHSEFGSFGRVGAGDGGKTAAETLFRQHRRLIDAGGRLDALHLDGPVRQMIRGESKHPNAPTLAQVAEILAGFYARVHKAWPRTRIGLITNFPNWDYTRDLPGFNGHHTDHTGVTYHEALGTVHGALTKAGQRIAFVSVDCPFGYYRRTRTRNNDAPVNNPKKFRALQKWCRDRGIPFNLIVNHEVPRPPKGKTLSPGQQAEADKRFHDGTLAYLRRLRADGIFPDEFLIQSWYVAPREHVPETKPHTFTHTALEAAKLIESLYPKKPSATA